MMEIKHLYFNILLCLTILLCAAAVSFSQEYELFSPNGKIKAVISSGDKVYYSISHQNVELVAPSPVSMTVRNYGILGKEPEIVKVERVCI